MAAKKKRTGKRGSQQVPGTLYGFSVQITRALAHLLRAGPGKAVSVEVLADVATESCDGTVLEEDKSGLAHNPIGDRSIDLWKTLHNWVDAIRSGALVQDTRFVLYVAQQHAGVVVDRLHQTTSRPAAIALVHDLREEFWGKALSFPEKAKLPEELGRHVNGVLEASDDVLARLIESFTLEMGSGSPNDDLLALLKEKPISETACAPILDYLLGWTKRSIDQAIEKGRPAILTWDAFNLKLIAAAKKFDRSGTVLSPTAVSVSRSEIDHELRSRTYVRQLQIVDSPESELGGAVNDFLRASADRTSWSERGDVLEGSFEEFEDALSRAWENQRKRVRVERSGKTEVEVGQVLLANCMGHYIRLQGMDLPPYFIPGSYHALSDVLSVGWHPRFKEALTTAAPRNSSPSRTGASSTGATTEAPERSDRSGRKS